MKAEILKMLRQTDGYLSGQQLCDRFQVSRTAVWKVINQLKEEGYEIEAVRNKGYRIVVSPDRIAADEIRSYLKTKWAAQKIEYFEETGSTNTQAKMLGEAGAPHGTLVVAEKQNAGKGRRGRNWSSPDAHNIYMSILLKPEFKPAQAPMLTLIMAYSAARAIRETEGIDVQIKWPNDLVLNKKKICGILTEMSAEIDFINHVVIGVGINANVETFPEEITGMATSILRETGASVKRAKLIAAIMENFEQDYEQFCKTGNLAPFQEEYNRMLVNTNCRVRVLEPGSEYDALALGINEMGELQVEREDGRRESVFAGEVSVRGIYGYV